MQYITSNGYTFALQKSEEHGAVTYEFVSLKKQPYPCVMITVFEDGATLDALNYYSSCSIGQKSLEKAHGTVHMLKTALAYVSRSHPEVIEFELQDETYVYTKGAYGTTGVNDDNAPLITSRRLLTGRLGWYEEHLQAEPTGRTIALLEYLRDPERRRGFGDKIPKEGDVNWTAANCVQVCKSIKCPRSVIGTAWKITREAVQKYGVDYKVELLRSEAGGNKVDSRSAKQSLLHVSRILKNARGFSYETTLRAKYRTPTLDK